MTDLSGLDYWRAAAAAAWARGRGYFYVAGMLWFAAVFSGTIAGMQAIAGLAAATALWGFCFAVGFRAFSSGAEANRLGLILTIGLPAVAFALCQFGWTALAALLPPGSVYYAAAKTSCQTWCLGAILTCVIALGITRIALAQCEIGLRGWYSKHHGKMLLE
jgi:hypothetical protein